MAIEQAFPNPESRDKYTRTNQEFFLKESEKEAAIKIFVQFLFSFKNSGIMKILD